MYNLPFCLLGDKASESSKEKVELGKGPGLPGCLANSWLCQAQGGHSQSQIWWGQVLGSVQATQGRQKAGVSSSSRLLLVSATKWRMAMSAIL